MLFIIAGIIYFLLVFVSFLDLVNVNAVWIALSALFAAIGLAVHGFYPRAK